MDFNWHNPRTSHVSFYVLGKLKSTAARFYGCVFFTCIPRQDVLNKESKITAETQRTQRNAEEEKEGV
jgi:hypothetical protein